MGNWKTLNKKTVYENKFLSLREDEVIDPNGNEGKRNLIEVGKGTVVIIAEKDDGGMYLVGQDRYAVGEYSWEFVSGGIKEGEEGLAAAKRELAEELGLEAGEWRYLADFHPSNSLMDRTAHVFLAKKLFEVRGENKGDDYERIDIRAKSFSEMKKDINNGGIKDALTICSFYFYTQNKEEDNGPN